MDRKRKVYAPFSQTSEAGVAQTPVEGYIGVNQTIYPSVDTGVIDENGTWRGVKSSDSEFIGFTKHIEVVDSARTISPDTANLNHIDMNGYRDLFIAIKPSQAGNHEIEARMGPDTNRFANLQPIGASASLRGCFNGIGNESDLEQLFKETAEGLQADVWNIFIIQGRLSGQRNLVFTIDNDTGSTEDLEFAFMRMV